jgi:hypothetical protein
MSLSKPENIFWSLAKKYSIIQEPSTAYPANVNTAQIPFKVKLLTAKPLELNQEMSVYKFLTLVCNKLVICCFT